MADIKISELSPAAPLTGAEEIPIVQSSTTLKTTVSDLAATSTLQSVTSGTNKNLLNGLNFQGTGAGDGNNRGDVNALGTDAGKDNDGEYVNALGNQAGNNNSGNDLNALGAQAGKNNTGQHLNSFGSTAAINNSGNNVNALGPGCANGNSGNNVNALGDGSAFVNTGSNVNTLGYNAGAYNTFSNVTLLGNSAQATAAKQLVLADGTVNARISYANISANRTYELPNTSGYFAVSTSVGYSGSKTIGGQVYTWQNGILISVV